MSWTRRDWLLGSAVTSFTRPARKNKVRWKRPNVIVLLSDDQGFGDLSLHGNPVLKTPNLDRIAQEGVQFTNFHVNPVCSPTRASLLTGRYCYRTGVMDTYMGRSMMRSSEVTVAEVLHKSGYRTGIFGKWHLGDHYPLRPTEHGFEEALVLDGGGIGQPSDPPEGNSYFNPRLHHRNVAVERSGYCTDIFFGAAMKWISANKDQPFFAYLTPNAPHSPLQVADFYVEPFRRAGLDEVTARTYGMLTNLDENTGRLLNHLRNEGLEERTILIFLSDNGPTPARFNAGLRGLKGTVYEGGIRVPFFARWPGTIPAGSRIDRLAAHIDLFPTLLDLCQVPDAAGQPKKALDGRSLVSLLQSNEASWPDRTLFFQWHRGDCPKPFRNSAVLTSRYKLVDGRELYDLSADEAETRNLASSMPDQVAHMRADYQAWFDDVLKDQGCAPTRIALGTEHENPVLLTRQDWRGPLASWDEGGLGFWEVDVQYKGDYRCRLLFPALDSNAQAKAKIGGIQAQVSVPAGDSFAEIILKDVPVGPTRVEVSLMPSGKPAIGPHYVNTERLI